MKLEGDEKWQFKVANRIPCSKWPKLLGTKVSSRYGPLICNQAGTQDMAGAAQKFSVCDYCKRQGPGLEPRRTRRLQDPEITAKECLSG